MRALNLKTLPVKTLVLSIVNIAAIALVAVTLLLIHSQDTQFEHIEPIAPEPLTVAVPGLGRAIDFTEIQARSLFYATRHYYVAPPPAVVLSKPNYRLVGTITLPQKPSIALLSQNETNSQIKVRSGDTVDGWTVESVDSVKVVMANGADRLEISRQQGRGMPLTASSINEAPRSGVLPVPNRSSGESAPVAIGQRRISPVANESSRLYRPPGR